ncbi:TlpA family protein disulfide reductase [Inhella sp.]|uniref:TlpA family protein disulfide reductase n=1 Tax=Inhella sp. TaxID=1921806 RepID=UPI0035B28FC5
MRRLLLSLVMALAMSAQAQSPAQAPPPFVLQGPIATGQVFDLARQRGRVVMVFYWATSCAVCRDKLPELRQNMLGWKDKPFDLVTVSVDGKEADWRAYEQLQAVTQPAAAQRVTSLWAGARGFRHSLGATPKLPLTLVIDAQGQVRQRVEGRMAPELWDEVAELLP